MKKLIVAAFAAVCAILGASAKTCTWTGAGGDAKASTAANWDTGAPVAGDAVVLSGDTTTYANANKAMTWDLAVALGSWTQSSDYTGTVTFSCPYDVSGANKIVVSGDVTVDNGTWTSASGKTIDFAIGGDFTFGADAKIDLIGKGDGVGTGCPNNSYDSGASYGGRGSIKATLTDAQVEEAYRNGAIAACYGAIYEPYSFGSYGSGAGIGGGLMRFVVAGLTTLDGKWYATGGGGDSRCASGGSIILTTGTIAGAGYMQVKGGKTNSRISLGGAGRIAVTLTVAGATFDAFTGNFGAYGTDGTVSTSDTSQYDVLPNANRTTYAGAGTVYLREGGEGVAEGTLYVDNCRDDWQTNGKVNWLYSVTELNASMPDLAFGKIVTRRGGQLRLVDAVTVETSVWSNGCKAVCDAASTVKLVGDKDGNAYVYGATTFGNLIVDSSVKNIYFESGTTFSVASSLQATGADGDHKIAFRSTEDGVAANLNVTPGAYLEAVFLDVKDVAASGAPIMAYGSTIDAGATGWTTAALTAGEEITWQGASSGWSVAANWNLGRSPVFSDRVVIPAGCAAYPTLPGAPITVSNLTVAANAALSLGGKALTVNGTASVSGRLTASLATEKIVFRGDVTLAAGALDAPRTPVEIAPAAASTFSPGGNVFDRLSFRKGAATLTTGFKTRFLVCEAGAAVKVAQDVALTAMTLEAKGTSVAPVSLTAAETDGTYVLTVQGLADVAYMTVGGADSSAGMTVYADATTTIGADVLGWTAADGRYYWTGGSSTAFGTAANWTVNGAKATSAPTASDDIVIDITTRTLEIPANQSVRSLLMKKGTVKLNAAFSVVRGVVLQGGTLTAQYPLTAGGSFLACSGATVNTTGGKVLTLAIGGDADWRTGSKLTVSSCGDNNTTGRPTSNTYDNGASYGGRGSLKGGPSTAEGVETAYRNGQIGSCYGSIYTPSFGSSGYAGTGGGCARLTVAGATHFDGKWYGTGGAGDSRCAAGGSLALTTATLDGAGYMQVKGGKTNGRTSLGGAGRIAVTLTAAGATYRNFIGSFGAFGTDGTVSTSDSTENDVLPSLGRTTYAGAGTVYLREGDDAIDEGALYIDNCRDDGKVNWLYSVTELNASMPDLAFGKIVTRRGGQLRLMDAVAVETSVWSNGCKAVCDAASTVKLVGDRNGNAYVYGATSFANLIVDSTVENLYFEAGTTFAFTKSLKVLGAGASAKMRVRSTADGTAFALNVAADAYQELKFLDVKDSVASGAPLTAQASVGADCTGWTFVSVEPGETITWCGTTTAWGTPENWLSSKSEVRAPVETDLVVIPAGCAAYPTLPNAAITVSNLTVAAGASLTLGGNALTVTGAANVQGTLAGTASSELVTFNGNVTLASGAVAAAQTPFVVAPGPAVTLDLGGNTFDSLTFKAGAVSLAGGFKASTLVYEPEAALSVAQDVEIEATVFRVAATSALPAEMTGAQSATYAFTVSGFAEVAGIRVGGADSSAGMTIYAVDSTFADAKNVNWSLGDTRYFWTGAASADYAAAANWLVAGEVPSEAPGADDDVVVNTSTRTMTVSSDGCSAKSVTLVSGTARVDAPFALTKALVLMSGTTLTANRKVTVGGSMLMFAGSTLTHNGQPANEQVNWCDFDVAGDVTIEAGALVELRLKGFGQCKGPGTCKVVGSLSTTYSASYGGRGYSTTDGSCYGSAICVTNVGSGASQSAGGGLFVLKTQGLLTFDGELRSDAGYIDSWTGSGGGVWLTAARLKGKGTINCNAGWSNNITEGGGGRVSLMLTQPGATFDDFTGTVTCYGGILGDGGGVYAQGAGTIYRQTGDQAFGCGTLTVENAVGLSSDAYNDTELGVTNLCVAGELKNVTLDLGRHGRVKLLGDVKVAALKNETEATARIDLNDKTLQVREYVHALKLDGSAAGASKRAVRAAQATTEKIVNRGKLAWLENGLMLLVR